MHVLHNFGDWRMPKCNALMLLAFNWISNLDLYDTCGGCIKIQQNGEGGIHFSTGTLA